MGKEKGPEAKVTSSKLEYENSLSTKNGFEWHLYSEKNSGFTLIELEDTETGTHVYTVTTNRNLRTPSIIAWAGARHSREAGNTQEIFEEIIGKSIDSDKKMEQTFVGYGHSSVADMSNINLYVDKVPMHLPMSLFNITALGKGQEKSTRFQSSLSGTNLQDLALYIPEGLPKDLVDAFRREYFENEADFARMNLLEHIPSMRNALGVIRVFNH